MSAAEELFTKQQCEYLRIRSKQRFDKIRSTMVDCALWTIPYRAKWMLSQEMGARANRHIVDTTHILALRSFVAGFMEGNTSATRPWYRIETGDQDVNNYHVHREWLDKYTRRTLAVLSNSNFYHACGQFYYDYGSVMTGAHYIDELKTGPFFHTLEPGSYYVLNNGYGEAVTMVREFSLTVKALVDTYSRKKGGMYDWSNFSSQVRKMYEDGNYTEQIDVVHVITQNLRYNPSNPTGGANRKWVSMTYELGACSAEYAQDVPGYGDGAFDLRDKDKYLKISFNKRKPFIVGRAPSSMNFEYGETGPTLEALGLIKSLNKKAIGKDQALEQMLRPTLQGPANLKKSYLTQAPGGYVPLDATALAKGGLTRVNDVNPAIAPLIQDVTDLRTMVDKHYYADYLLYLSRNPKTRTATETNAIVEEQQRIIGPNLQQLNWTYNVPVVEFVMDYVLWEDPQLDPPPEALAGQFLRPMFISVFAQAQRAADLPAINQYLAMVEQVGQLNPKIWDKANVDKLADLYEDRLFLPAGLNRPQDEVDALRQQQEAQAQRERMLTEALPAVAGAAKDLSAANNNQ